MTEHMTFLFFMRPIIEDSSAHSLHYMSMLYCTSPAGAL